VQEYNKTINFSTKKVSLEPILINKSSIAAAIEHIPKEK